MHTIQKSYVPLKAQSLTSSLQTVKNSIAISKLEQTLNKVEAEEMELRTRSAMEPEMKNYIVKDFDIRAESSKKP